jgi:tetratricopeptide (TPR) repeat protein
MGLRHLHKVLSRAASIAAVAAFSASPWALSAQEKAPMSPDIPAPPQEHRAEPPAMANPHLPPQMPPQIGPRKQQRITRQNKAEFLSTLYEQLEKASSEEAADLVAKAIERVWRQSGSDTADVLMERAGIAIQTKNLDLALQILSALVEVAPSYAEGWNQLATVYFMQEDYDKAMRGLRQVLALEPKHYKAIEGLGLILREMGDKKGTLRATRRALSVYPHLKSAQQAQEELMRDVEGQGI